MKISHTKKMVQNQEVVEEVICNCCGKPIKKYKSGDLNDYIHINKSFGYFSNHDKETHKFDMCEECYEKLISTFKFKPEITEYVECV